MNLLRVLAALALFAAAAAAQTMSATTDGGAKVQLFADGTWAYAEQPGEPATGRLTADSGPYAVIFNPKKWSTANSSATNRHLLRHSTGNAGAVFASEAIPVALERLPAIALANAQNADPAAELISSEMATVSGVEVVRIEIEATVQGVPFHYRSYYFGGTQGNSALVVYAHRDHFEALAADMDELLGGFEIHDTPLHASPEETRRTFELNGGGAAFTVDTLQWKPTKSESGRHEFQSLDGSLFAIVIDESNRLPLDNLVSAALVNAQQTDPEASVVLDEDVAVLGLPARRITMDVQPSGLALTFYSLLYSDESGAYQVICFTTPEKFEASQAAFEDFHGGFRPTAGGD